MNCVKITPLNLFGNINVPPSKSLCHRAIIAAGLANGTSTISNVVFSNDINATCNAMRDLGVEVQKNKDSITIKGNNLLNCIKNEIDCGESASTLRFLIPVALSTAEKITFTGKEGLRKRPLDPYLKIFQDQKIPYTYNDGLPLSVNGILTAGDYEIEGNISSQFLTGLMFALPLLEGDSRIIVTTNLESKGYVDLTIDILKKFSVKIGNNNNQEFYIKGGQKYVAADYTTESDYSQAAFWLVAGILGDEIGCRGLNITSLQGDRKILDIISDMGGSLHIKRSRIVTNASRTRGITIDASQIPDLVPIISVLASVSEGTTDIINAGRLRIKESDRLKSTATELKKLGADVTEKDDGLIIKGKEKLKGGVVESWNDHRIAMAMSVASIRCTEPVIIRGSNAINKSYPSFYKDFAMLGGSIEEFTE
ncbi:3-phosphoshikimate 1-carboxyvinyltransferase [Oxobacter pfennigii]|uniref:3-phosphoshikimate 1-carboxyvinyltransferase n=1 Tax=Oxobacter pfennigii TaxID=36849 RepID=A0A0P8WCI5_9CLOT|nr:3-phosphoshikimate 1-carboxyvinyltransferase [Oxobacter pfennigii]KPU45449.1 3-phosphoshikimate 1-carboxyvinyltransferase [Oxobacter pfennigii]